MQMKNRSHRYDIDRPKSWHGHKYSKYKKRLSMVMLMCIKQHLSHWKKSVAHKKECRQKVAIPNCSKSMY